MRDPIYSYIQRATTFEPEAFDALALALYRWQRAHSPAYDALCGDARPRRFPEIPAVPVALFRDLALCCFPPEEARVIFRTSGTTGGQQARGQHRLRDTAIADLSARRGVALALGALPTAGLALVPPEADSSLGHMCRLLAPDLQWAFSLQGGVDHAAAWAALRAAAAPVFVPATAFALADLLFPPGGPPAPCPLPAGSTVMITGGFKGRLRAVDEAGLRAAAAAAFPGARIVGEYGMTELSSQLWASPAGAAYRPPPWMRAFTVDPWSGDPAPEGLLRFLDLANHESVLAIETQDLGRVAPDGSVTLLGRLEGAPARGCSLSVEDAAHASR